MHPEIVSDKPGLCPECGMALLPQRNHHSPRSNDQEGHTHKHTEYDKHAGHSTNIFKRKFWASLVLTVPIVLYSEVAQKIGIVLPQLEIGPPGGGWKLEVLIPAVLGSAVFFYGGWIFLLGAYRELRARLPGMMTLIALAITAAYLYSIFVVLFDGTKTLFWELSTLVTIMLLGHWIEMRAVSGAQGALRELSKLLPDTAEVVRSEGVTETVPLAALAAGDKVLVKPGAKVPADGVVVHGQSELNESLLTGESKPVEKAVGDEVIAGAINGDGSLIIEIKQIGEHTFLAGIKRLVAEAQASKSRLQLLADRAALLLTVIAVVAGGLTLSVWLFLGAGIAFAMSRLVAVLVVACPHALGLAIPLVASISTTKGAQNGVLVKQRLALEAARHIDIVLFDKTGTLTRGEYGVTDILPIEGTVDEVLSRAASVEYFSEHLIAQAVVDEAKRRKLPPVPASKFERIPGKGAKAIIDGMTVKVGSYQLLKEEGIALPLLVKEQATALAREGKTIIFVLSGRALSGALALADIIRPESKEAIRSLKEMGVKIAMVTGDSEEVGKWVARELELDEYFARVLPGEKAAKVKLLQQKREKVAMVGDGVNDAPALTQADLGIAIGAGTNVAIESAGIILVKSDPRDIPKIIRLSKMTHRKMIQNLWWAAGYNIIAIPLAAGVLASRGVFLEPAVAAVFMSLSTVIVAVNAMMLRHKSL
jgi:Cu2+-exporting ATPase